MSSKDDYFHLISVPGFSDSADFRACTYGKCQEIGNLLWKIFRRVIRGRKKNALIHYKKTFP